MYENVVLLVLQHSTCF